MAAKGKNTTDGYDYQLYTLLYCDFLLRGNDRLSDYKIGSEIVEYEALEDVVIEATFKDDKCLTYCLQVKQAESDKFIDMDALANDQNRLKLNVLKYFKSFLKITKPVGNATPVVPLTKLHEMIIWCPFKIHDNVLDLFQQYSPTDYDLLKPQQSYLNYGRYRIVDYQKLAENFLEQTHPLAVLAEKFVRAISRKEQWSSKGAAKSCYRVMAREVINNNGDKSSFRDEFLRGDQSLKADTLLFRKLFEQALRKSPKCSKNFSLQELNKLLQNNVFQLIVDPAFTIGNNDSWNVKEYVPVEQDLKDFFDRFIFYVEVPKVPTIKSVLLEMLNPDFDQFEFFMDKCTFNTFITKEQITLILSLIKMRKEIIEQVDAKLQFDKSALSKLRESISECKFLHIDAMCDQKCSVSRVFSILNNDLEVAEKRFVFFPDWNSFIKEKQLLLSILAYSALSKHGLKYIVVRCDTVLPFSEISLDFSSVDVQILVVVNERFDASPCYQWSVYSDDFDVSFLSKTSKDIVNGKEISFFGGTCVKVKEFFTESELFVRNNYKLVLSLFRTSGVTYIGDKLESNPYFVARSIKQKVAEENANIDLLGIDNTRPSSVIISDKTGMGKTTELIHLAIKLREKYKDSIIVYLSCNQAIQFYPKQDKKGDKILHMICALVENRNESVTLLVKKLIDMQKWMLLIDAYDEIASDFYNHLNTIIKSALDAGLPHLYITTKPHFEKALTEILPESVVCTLGEFTVENQLETLKTRGIEEQTARAIIERYSRILRRQKDSLLGIPMQINMIVEIYTDDEQHANFTVPEPYEIGAIVERFTNIKLSRYLENFVEYIDIHKEAMELAKAAFPDGHVQLARRMFLRVHDSDTIKLCKKYLVYKLVQQKPSIGFVHEIYQDFFLTMYLLNYHTDNEIFKNYMKRNLCKERINIATRFLDFHIGKMHTTATLKMLSEENISVENETPCTLTLPPTIRIPFEKHKQFHWYLSNQCTEDEVYTLIRTSFNASAFNVFEVLYDSLPKQIGRDIRFRFGAKEFPQKNSKKSRLAQSEFINLKQMGENQVLQLLSILRKKHPESFVTRFLTDFQNDEEDFLEVACRKPFLVVLEWFIKLDDVKTGEHQLNALSSYVQRRLAGYLRLVVLHNNSRLLQKVVDWVKTKFLEAETCAIIKELNIIKVFIENIAVKGDTKSLLIDRRVELIKIMSDLLQWACNGTVLNLDNECVCIVNNMQIAAIKSELDCFIKSHFKHENA
ncbi:uncharacterized protein LOC128741741 [Sabethes cyaneus]|uniref:uncharacterized protein LOC128741741 n=1 Tax=Sabethes cyaneus TaxID=53552 RepID=UPI00237EBC4D|nr:uncharacterized protein LOC128741741 [Sabethes cyaneus]